MIDSPAGPKYQIAYSDSFGIRIEKVSTVAWLQKYLAWRFGGRLLDCSSFRDRADNGAEV